MMACRTRVRKHRRRGTKGVRTHDRMTSGINISKREAKLFLDYVYDLERYASDQYFSNKWNETVANVFEKLQKVAK